MPTYDYRCNGCSHTFEHFQAISDKLLRKCPECGKPKLERLIGAGAGFLFKGAGFYITDYRSNSYHEGAKKESGAPATPATPAKGDGAATPAKPAATVEKSGGEKPTAAASNKEASSKPSTPSTPPPSSSSSKPSKKR
jgi:putative FmdB family regulatory protein